MVRIFVLWVSTLTSTLLLTVKPVVPNATPVLTKPSTVFKIKIALITTITFPLKTVAFWFALEVTGLNLMPAPITEYANFANLDVPYAPVLV